MGFSLLAAPEHIYGRELEVVKSSAEDDGEEGGCLAGRGHDGRQNQTKETKQGLERNFGK